MATWQTVNVKGQKLHIKTFFLIVTDSIDDVIQYILKSQIKNYRIQKIFHVKSADFKPEAITGFCAASS
jgi:hypothetical protein